MGYDSTPSQLDRIESQCAETGRDVKKLNQHMFGNGQPERGHVVRLDRLERDAKRSGRFSRTVVTAIVSSIVAVGTAMAIGAVG